MKGWIVMKKRILPALLCVLMLGLTACSNQNVVSNAPVDSSVSSAVSSENVSSTTSSEVSSIVSSATSSTVSAAVTSSEVVSKTDTTESAPKPDSTGTSSDTVSEEDSFVPDSPTQISNYSVSGESGVSGIAVSKSAAVQANPSSSEEQTPTKKATPAPQVAAPSVGKTRQADAASNSTSSQATSSAVSTPTYCEGLAGEVEQKLFQKINDKRVELGLGALTWDSTYHAASHVRAVEMPTLFEHQRPDGRTWSTIFAEMGLPSYPGRENLVYAGNGALVLDVDGVVDVFYDGWINSPSHYENIVATDVNVSGLCVIYTEKDIYAVQLFGHKDL